MTYATRENVHVDRCASAWLIRRFIDPKADFIFVMDGQVPAGATPFDMPNVDWGHHGNKCTFEVLLEKHNLLKDDALRQIGEIIHGADIVADYDSTLESPGIDLAFRGLRLISRSDDEAIEHGCLLMDALYKAIQEGYRR